MQFSNLILAALEKAGKQESLAPILDLSPSALSKRMNSEVGWTESEINKLLDYTKSEIVSVEEYSKKIETLKDAMKILLNGN
jgi:hypothetical protein